MTFFPNISYRQSYRYLQNCVWISTLFHLFLKICDPNPISQKTLPIIPFLQFLTQFWVAPVKDERSLLLSLLTSSTCSLCFRFYVPCWFLIQWKGLNKLQRNVHAFINLFLSLIVYQGWIIIEPNTKPITGSYCSLPCKGITLEMSSLLLTSHLFIDVVSANLKTSCYLIL